MHDSVVILEHSVWNNNQLIKYIRSGNVKRMKLLVFAIDSSPLGWDCKIAWLASRVLGKF